MTDLVKKFIDTVSEKDVFQRQYLRDWQATDSEKEELNLLLHFFMDEFHYDMGHMVEAYLFINKMIMEETYYFVRHGNYRNSTYEEVNNVVYANPDYMKKYMMGLSISDYIWIGHIKMLRYFVENSDKFGGERYLEIGPGFGQYLVRAIINCNFTGGYYACDVSETSVEGCNRYLKYRNLADKCKVIQKDFFQFTSDEQFDCIVMGEVLEHVEQPLLMLRKIYELLRQKGKAFITTVINGPTIDHIFLFRDVKQVLDLVKAAGFKITDYICTTERDVALERAINKKMAINIALILEKAES